MNRSEKRPSHSFTSIFNFHFQLSFSFSLSFSRPISRKKKKKKKIQQRQKRQKQQIYMNRSKAPVPFTFTFNFHARFRGKLIATKRQNDKTTKKKRGGFSRVSYKHEFYIQINHQTTQIHIDNIHPPFPAPRVLPAPLYTPAFCPASPDSSPPVQKFYLQIMFPFPSTESPSKYDTFFSLFPLSARSTWKRGKKKTTGKN